MDVIVSGLEWFGLGAKEENGDQRVLAPYTRIWGALGLWPMENGQQTRLSYLYPRFVVMLLCSCGLIYTYSLSGRENTFFLALEHVFTLLFLAMALAKNATYLCQPIRVAGLCRDLDTLNGMSRREGIPHVDNLLRRTRLFSRFCAVYLPLQGVTSAALLTAALCGFAFFKGKPFLSVYRPCDVSSSPCLQITILIDGLSIYNVLQLMCLCDAFFIDVLAQTLTQGKILNYNLRNIRDYAINKVDEDTARAEVVLDTGEDVRVDVEAGYSLPHTADAGSSLTLTAGSLAEGTEEDDATVRIVSAEMRAAKNLAIEREMKRRLGECVDHQNALISLISDIQTVYSPYLLSQVANNLMETATITLYVLIAPKWELKEIGMILIDLLVISIFLVFSWFSNQITSQCSKVKLSVYSSDWLEASESFKRSMRIIISRSNERVVIRIGGSVPLSLETYRLMAKNAVSYFMALNTIARKK